MNSETRLIFPLDVVPKSGTMHEINKHVRWIRMPLPMSLNHINLWGLGTQDNLTLVDTGMHLDETKNAWINLIEGENLSVKDVGTRIEELHEQNPMLGHRGCRLAISFPEIYEMQCSCLLYTSPSPRDS